MSADDLAMLKEGNPEKQQQYQTLLKKVQWQDYVVRLQTRSRSVILSQAPLFDLFMMPAVSIRTGENLTLCLCTRIPVNARPPPFPPPNHMYPNLLRFELHKKSSLSAFLPSSANCSCIQLAQLSFSFCCREYEGQVRMRYTVQSMKPVEFITESRRMIEQLTKLRVKAEAA